MSSRAQAKSSYFPTNSSTGMSPGLLRAREPFFLRNAITGAVLVSFATWVYWYSISAVKQDDFSGADVQLLEEQERSRRQGLQSALAQDVQSTATGAPLGASESTSSSVLSALSTSQQHSHAQGTLAQFFRGRQAESHLVYGAPDVDKPGKFTD